MESLIKKKNWSLLLHYISIGLKFCRLWLQTLGLNMCHDLGKGSLLVFLIRTASQPRWLRGSVGLPHWGHMNIYWSIIPAATCWPSSFYSQVCKLLWFFPRCDSFLAVSFAVFFQFPVFQPTISVDKSLSLPSSWNFESSFGSSPLLPLVPSCGPKKKISHRASAPLLALQCGSPFLPSLPKSSGAFSNLQAIPSFFLSTPPAIYQSTWQPGTNLKLIIKKEVAKGEICSCCHYVSTWYSDLSKSKGLWDILHLMLL